MKLIIGLGNPGTQYKNTRHNVGFFMLDILREKIHSDDWGDSRFHGLLSRGENNTTKVLLLKPTTFMNLSGESVASIVSYYQLDPVRDILVISDDIDMEFTKVRYRNKGSHGGQNGIRDIITKLGTSDFARLKIGIGRHDQMSVSDWVLSKFSKGEQDVLISEVYPRLEDQVIDWLSSSL